MKMEFPAEPPISKEERMKILMNIRDEDIDCSDMPELTEEDFARAPAWATASSRGASATLLF